MSDGFMKKCQCGQLLEKESLRQTVECPRCKREWEAHEPPVAAA